MYMAAHAKADYFQLLRKHGITGELSKHKIPYLTGWYNNITNYGHYFCDDPNDTETALKIFEYCGFNYCRIKGTRCIEIMHDSKKKTE